MQKLTIAAITLVALLALTGWPIANSEALFRSPLRPVVAFTNFYDVKDFGATGNGKTIDSSAINRAIDAAAAAGGGTLHFSAGRYLCFSIRLKSNIALYLDHGATLVAADPQEVKGSYDQPEPNEWDMYQDFGHSHWQNSLIWGIGLDNVSIIGPGMIDGKGLTRRSPRPRRPLQSGDTPTSLGGAETSARVQSPLGEGDDPSVMKGLGNKAIGLKLCRNVLLRDFSVLNGGHFALLATGVDNLTIDNVKVDTNRDGFDIDNCRNTRISNCSVNAPNDDAIVLKSSYALGELRACENITINGCQVSGWDVGSFLDGTFTARPSPGKISAAPPGRKSLHVSYVPDHAAPVASSKIASAAFSQSACVRALGLFTAFTTPRTPSSAPLSKLATLAPFTTSATARPDPR